MYSRENIEDFFCLTRRRSCESAYSLTMTTSSIFDILRTKMLTDTTAGPSRRKNKKSFVMLREENRKILRYLGIYETLFFHEKYHRDLFVFIGNFHLSMPMEIIFTVNFIHCSFFAFSHFLK